MGGDCSHYAGMLRPTKYVPMPATIPPGQLDAHYPPMCACSLFTAIHPMAGRSATNGNGGDHAGASSDDARLNPFYDVSRKPHGAYTLGDLAQESVDKVKILDAQKNVFVCLAHDRALVEVLPLYNNSVDAVIKDWNNCGYKEKTRWGFLNELPRDGNPGRPLMAEGLWRDGNKVVWKDGEGLVELTS